MADVNDRNQDVNEQEQQRQQPAEQPREINDVREQSPLVSTRPETAVTVRTQEGNVTRSRQIDAPITVSQNMGDGTILHNFFSSGMTAHFSTPGQLQVEHTAASTEFRVPVPGGRSTDATTTVSQAPDGNRLIQSSHQELGTQTVTVSPAGDLTGFTRSGPGLNLAFALNSGNDAVLSINNRTTALNQLSGIEQRAAMGLIARSTGALAQSTETQIQIPQNNLLQNDASSLSDETAIAAMQALETPVRDGQISAEMTQAFQQAVREGKEAVFIQAMNNALALRNSPYQFEHTVGADGSRTLSLRNSAGILDSIRLVTTDGAPPVVQTAEQQMREGLRTQLPAFINAEGTPEQRRQAREQAISALSSVGANDVYVQDVIRRMQAINSGSADAQALEQGLRAEAISLAIPANPSIENLRTAENQLQLEAENNPAARDMLARISVERMMAGVARPESASQSITELQQAARNGNAHARNALASLLAGDEQNGRRLWADANPSLSPGERPIPNTNISQLSPELQSQMRLAAANTLTELGRTTPLSRAETTALALAFNQAPNDSPLRTTVANAFTNIFNPPDRTWGNSSAPQRATHVAQVENALRSLSNVLTSTTTNGESVAGLYILGTQSDFNRALSAHGFETGRGHDFARQVSDIDQAARDGNRGALAVLAAITGGAGRQNTNANDEIENPNRTAGQPRYIPGDHIARRAQQTLLEIAQTDRQAVLDTLSSRAQEILGDRSLRLETLGRVAALDPTNIPQQVREQLRAGLGEGSPEARRSAVSGLMALGGALNSEDLRAIAQNPSPEVTQRLRSTQQPALTEAQARQVLQNVREGLPASAGDRRANALDMMAALSRHATAADVTAIGAIQPRPVEARSALLAIAQHGSDGALRTSAFNAFASRVTSAELGDRDLQQQLRQLQRAHPEDLTINLGVARLITDAARPTTAAIFAERGAPFSDSVMQQLVDRATTNYSAERVNQVLDRIALFNSLPPDVRRQLSGSSSPLAEGQTLNLGGAVLDRDTFNALPPEVRQRLSGSTEQLPSSRAAWPDLARANLDAASVNSLPPDLRRALTGSDQQVPAGQNVSLRGRTIDSETFNRLPPAMREAMTGSNATLPPGRTLRDFSTVNLTAQEFNGLSEPNRRNVSGRVDSVDAGLALAQMGNRTLDAADSRNRFLLGDPPLEQRVSTQATEAANAQRTAEQNLEAFRLLRESMLGRFQATSQESVGLINRALHLVPGIESPVTRFEQNQISQLVNLQQINELIRRAELDLQQATARSNGFSIAQQSMEHSRLLREGNTAQADRLALRMYTTFGAQMAVMAPNVMLSLAGGGEQSGWARLHRAGLVQSPEMPTLSGQTAAQQLESALALARGTRSINDNNQSFGDATLRRQTVTSAIAQNADVQHMMQAFRTVSENFQVLSIEGNAGGTRYPNFVQDARRRADAIETALRSISDDQVRNVVQLRDQLRTALAAQGSNAINDAETRRQLEQQLGQLSAALQFFNRSEPVAIAPGRLQQIQGRLSELNPLLDRATIGDASSPGSGRQAMIQQFNMRVAYPGEPEAHMFHRYVTQWRQERAQLQAEQAFANGGNGRQRLEGMMAMIRSDDFHPHTFGEWLVREGPSVAAGIAVGAVFAVATGGTGLIAMAAGAGGYLLGSASAREYQFQFGLRSTGSNWGEYMRGTPIRDEHGNLRPRTYLGDVALPFTLDLAVSTLTGAAAAGLGSIIGTTLRGAFSRMSTGVRDAFMRENGPAVTQLANNLARLESAAVTASQRQMAQQLLGRMLQDGGFMALQTASEEGLRHSLPAAIGDSNAIVGFVAGVILSAGHSGLSVQARPNRQHQHGSNAPHASLQFHGTPAQERQFFREAELRGSTITQTQHGYTELTAQGLRIEYTRVGRGEGTPHLALHPQGNPLSIQERAGLPTEVQVGGSTWRRSSAHEALQTELNRFASNFLGRDGQPNFSEALRLGQSTDGFPPNLTVRQHEVPLDLAALQSASGTPREAILREAMSQMSRNSHAPSSLQGNPELVVARPTIVVDGIRIDLTDLSHVGNTAGGAATPERIQAATEQVRQFRNTPEGQRLMAEQAIIRMEERLHIQQLQNGNQVFSPSYARYLAEQPNGHETISNPSGRSRASLEQELIFAMHDAGWSVEHLRHHFGNHHSAIREPIFRYLEGLPSLPRPVQESLTRFGNAHPEAAPLMERASRIPQQYLEAAGVLTAINRDGATVERVGLAVRHAEVLHRINSMPADLQEGLRASLLPVDGRSRPNSRQIAFVEEVLNVGAERLPESVREILRRPELVDYETCQALRPDLRRAAPPVEVTRPAVTVEPLTPQRRNALLTEAFDASTELAGFHSPETIARARREAARFLAEHWPGAEPDQVHAGQDQITIVLRHGDGSRTVVKFDTRGEWVPNWGTRPWDCETIPINGQRRQYLGSGSDRWVVYQQPYAEQPTTAQVEAFHRLLARHGRRMGDGGVAEADIRQIGIVNGRPVLIDYDAVSP